MPHPPENGRASSAGNFSGPVQQPTTIIWNKKQNRSSNFFLSGSVVPSEHTDPYSARQGAKRFRVRKRKQVLTAPASEHGNLCSEQNPRQRKMSHSSDEEKLDTSFVQGVIIIGNNIITNAPRVLSEDSGTPVGKMSSAHGTHTLQTTDCREYRDHF